jgi:hypothetical protein
MSPEELRQRKRARKLELLLLRWLQLEESYDNAQGDKQLDRAEEAIKNHCALVRRALFR